MTEPSTETLALRVSQQCIARRVRRLARKVSRLYDEAMRPHGITVAQFGMLTALLRHGSTSPTTLATTLDLEKSTVSRNVARMIDAGWVKKTTGDARGLELAVQAAGRRVFERAMPAWEAAQAQAAALMATEAVAR